MQAWLTLALAIAFADDLTLLGLVANLIVRETARRRGSNRASLSTCVPACRLRF